MKGSPGWAHAYAPGALQLIGRAPSSWCDLRRAAAPSGSLAFRPLSGVALLSWRARALRMHARREARRPCRPAVAACRSIAQMVGPLTARQPTTPTLAPAAAAASPYLSLLFASNLDACARLRACERASAAACGSMHARDGEAESTGILAIACTSAHVCSTSLARYG